MVTMSSKAGDRGDEPVNADLAVADGPVDWGTDHGAVEIDQRKIQRAVLVLRQRCDGSLALRWRARRHALPRRLDRRRLRPTDTPAYARAERCATFVDRRPGPRRWRGSVSRRRRSEALVASVISAMFECFWASACWIRGVLELVVRIDIAEVSLRCFYIELVRCANSAG